MDPTSLTRPGLWTIFPRVSLRPHNVGPKRSDASERAQLAGTHGLPHITNARAGGVPHLITHGICL